MVKKIKEHLKKNWKRYITFVITIIICFQVVIVKPMVESKAFAVVDDVAFWSVVGFFLVMSGIISQSTTTQEAKESMDYTCNQLKEIAGGWDVFDGISNKFDPEYLKNYFNEQMSNTPPINVEINPNVYDDMLARVKNIYGGIITTDPIDPTKGTALMNNICQEPPLSIYEYTTSTERYIKKYVPLTITFDVPYFEYSDRSINVVKYYPDGASLPSRVIRVKNSIGYFDVCNPTTCDNTIKDFSLYFLISGGLVYYNSLRLAWFNKNSWTRISTAPNTTMDTWKTTANDYTFVKYSGETAPLKCEWDNNYFKIYYQDGFNKIYIGNPFWFTDATKAKGDAECFRCYIGQHIILNYPQEIGSTRSIDVPVDKDLFDGFPETLPDWSNGLNPTIEIPTNINDLINSNTSDLLNPTLDGEVGTIDPDTQDPVLVGPIEVTPSENFWDNYPDPPDPHPTDPDSDAKLQDVLGTFDSLWHYIQTLLENAMAFLLFMKDCFNSFPETMRFCFLGGLVLALFVGLVSKLLQ